MKNFYIFLFCMLGTLNITTIQASTQPDDITLISQGEIAYQSGNFQQAYDAFKSVTKKNASVLYNIGNCAYKLNKQGEALLNWRRAQQRTSGLWAQPDISSNIALLKKTVAEKTAPQATDQSNTPSISLTKINQALHDWHTATPLLFFQLLFLLFWLILFVSIRHLIRRKNTLLIVLIGLFVTISGTMLAYKYGTGVRRYGVVVASEAILFSGPGTNFSHLKNLPETAEFRILTELHGFFKIKGDGNTMGWVSVDQMSEV